MPAYRLLILIVFFTIPAWRVLQMDPSTQCVLLDADLGWHLRTGQWVVEHGAVPATDPFSSFGQDRPWVAYSWLFDVLVYECHAALGLFGILLLTLVLSYLITLVLYRFITSRIPAFLPGMALAGLALLPLLMMFSPRPWLFTILFCLLTLEVILRVREGRDRWTIWLLPGAYVLWANLHIQLIYGLLLLLLAGVTGFEAEGRKPSGEGIPEGLRPSASSPATRLLALFLLCGLATLVNPYHVRLYGVMWEYATQPGPYQIINELQAPTFREMGDWLTLLLFGLAAAALGRRRSGSLFEVLLLAGAAVLAFRARRDLWVLVVASVAILCRDEAVRGLNSRLDPFRWTWPRLLGVTAAVSVLALVRALGEDVSEPRLQDLIESRYPASAVAVVRRWHYPGPLYNDINWGGYLIWKLPELPVAIDGRTNLYGDERLLRFQRVESGELGWESDPDLGAAGVVILPRAAPLARLLERDARFEAIPLDDFSPARLFITRRKAPQP